MVNEQTISKEEFEDMIDEARTLPTDLKDGLEFFVQDLRRTSNLTRAKITEVFGDDFANRIFQPNSIRSGRNRERDEDTTEQAIAGAIAMQRASYAQVLSLNSTADGKTIEAFDHRGRPVDVPTGSIIENPSSASTKEVALVYNFLRSATSSARNVIRATDVLTNDDDYTKIIELQKILDEDSAFDEARYTAIGKPLKEYEVATMIPGTTPTGTELEKAYQNLVNLTAPSIRKKDQNKIALAQSEIQSLIQEYNTLNQRKQNIEKLRTNLKFTKPKVKDEDITLYINNSPETKTLQEWIDSGRLLQFADRIQSMKVKSTRGRVSAEQFLKEATMYHLFGKYKELNQSEAQELEQTMKSFVDFSALTAQPATSTTATTTATTATTPVAPQRAKANAFGDKAYYFTVGAFKIAGKTIVLPFTTSGKVLRSLSASVQHAAKTIWKNL